MQPTNIPQQPPRSQAAADNEKFSYDNTLLVLALTLDGRTTTSIVRTLCHTLPTDPKALYGNDATVYEIQRVMRDTLQDHHRPQVFQKMLAIGMVAEIGIWCTKEGFRHLARGKEVDTKGPDYPSMQSAAHRRSESIDSQYGYTLQWWEGAKDDFHRRLEEWRSAGKIKGNQIPEVDN